MLRRIDKVKRQFAHRLFQCLAVAVRPLRVEELAEILAVRFDAGALPQFNTSWRLGDAEEAVLSACSSFITVINVGGSRIVQFSHFSVKEFLTSDRLATASEDLSCYHVNTPLAHATLTQACIAVLLQLDDRINKDSISNFPLADYAARHWFEHGRFGDVSLPIRDASVRLFDRGRSHFSAWVWIYDIDDPWREPMPTKHPEQPEAPPLYYAIHCRLRWLVDLLMEIYPEDIDATGGYHRTPWIAAFYVGDIEVACSLLRSGVDINVLDSGGSSPLHRASQSGHTEIVRLLLEHNADVDFPTRRRETPLFLASCDGHVHISQLLVQEGADMTFRTEGNSTPLHVASRNGHLDIVRLFINNGADVDSLDDEGWTLLHLAASGGHVDIVKLLLESGADFNIRNDEGKTALDLASVNGKVEVASFLSGHKACAISLDRVVKSATSILHPQHKPPKPVQRLQPLQKRGEKAKPDDGWPPLHTASGNGQIDVVRALLDQGSDVNEMNGRRVTALLVASAKGMFEAVKLLIDRGAGVNLRNRVGCTPVLVASGSGNLEAVRLLLDHGADVNAQTRDRFTALHMASSGGHLHVVQLLVERGADLDVRNVHGQTARQKAIAHAHYDVAEFLSECGAYI